jgi:hypothetical protein
VPNLLRRIAEPIEEFASWRGPVEDADALARGCGETYVVHCIELNANRTLGLNELAVVAMMSDYNFLPTFRQVVGMTPTNTS